MAAHESERSAVSDGDAHPEPAHDWWPAEPGETTHHRLRRLTTTGYNTERTVFFSDAVMAIAMTLLVLEIHLPNTPVNTDAEQRVFAQALIEDAGQLYAFVLGFVLIALAWLGHHRKFKMIRRYDARLQLINLLFLFFIALLPVATGALAISAQTLTAVVYAAIVASCWATQAWLWAHAHRAELFDPVVDRAMYRSVRDNQLPTVAVFLLSIPLALFIGSSIAMYFWIVLVPVQFVVGHLVSVRAARDARVSRSRG